MNEKGNRYAIHALKDRRAAVADEIVQMKEGITYPRANAAGAGQPVLSAPQ
jgi:hypothetical protein